VLVYHNPRIPRRQISQIAEFGLFPHFWYKNRHLESILLEFTAKITTYNLLSMFFWFIGIRISLKSELDIFGRDTMLKFLE
jgi:hypothetical protein